MKQILIVITIILLTVSNLLAKTSDFKGFIITKNKDTIYGFINYKNRDINPKGIKFKKTNNSKAKYYPAGSITQFNTEGEIYVSAIV